MGKVIYGDSPEGKPWIEARCEELDEGHLKSLVHALRSHIVQHKEARECIHYIWKNRRRMSGLREQFATGVPNPGRAIAQHRLTPGLGETAAAGLALYRPASWSLVAK